jgi:hypothetical protein
LWLRQGRPADAVALLAPVYDRFTDGRGDADAVEARQLLDTLLADAGPTART